MKILTFFKKFYEIYLAIILVLLVFVAPFINYTYKRNYAMDNIPQFLIGFFAVALIIFILIRKKNKYKKIIDYINTKHGFNVIVVFGAVIIFLLEMLIVSGGWFIVGWDTRNIIFPNMQTDSEYMSMYPNQLFIAGLFRFIYKLLQFIGITDFCIYYFILVLFSTLLTLASIILVAYISKKITNNFCGICTYFSAGFFLGLSPWIMVPYSDNFAMFCTVFILFSYTCLRKKPVKWFLIFLVSVVGTAIKPTVIFVLLAILFVEIVLIVTRHIKTSLKSFIFSSIAVIISVICALFIVNSVTNYDVKINKDASFTHTHFLMMGINLETIGGWNNKDVQYTKSFKTIEEREKANIDEWQRRVKEYGPINVIMIYLKKNLSNYGDGTFAWEAERPWSIENIGNNPFIHWVYGIDPPNALNDNNNYFTAIWQKIWLMIILGNVFLLLKKRNNKYISIMSCSMLAISVFLMIYEPDPRYIMLYVPYMIIMGVQGFMYSVPYFNKIFIKIEEKYKRRKIKKQIQK